jgi:hypothetical protein
LTTIECMHTTEPKEGDRGTTQKKDTQDIAHTAASAHNNYKDKKHEQSDNIKNMKDSIADLDKEITLKNIKSYPPEKKKHREDDIKREIFSLIDYSEALGKV